MEQKKPAIPKDKRRRVTNQPSNIIQHKKLPHNNPGSINNSVVDAPVIKMEISSVMDANENWRKPITNQDEQEKIINNDDEGSVKDI